MGIENTAQPGRVRSFFNNLVSIEAQKKEEVKFNADVDQLKKNVDSLGQRIVNFLEKNALDFITKPLISGLTPIQPQVDEDGEEIPLTLKEKLANFHRVTVAQGGDEFAIKAGVVAHGLTRRALQPIQKGAKLFGREHMGATVQNSVALVIGALVRSIFFALSQLAHLRTAAAAVGVAVVGALTVAVPQVACLLLALETNKLGKEVQGLKTESKAKARAEKAQAEQSATNVRRAKILLGVALAAGAAYAAYSNPAVVASAASTVASAASAATSTVANAGRSVVSFVGSLFASKVAQPMCGLDEGRAICSANMTNYSIA